MSEFIVHPDAEAVAQAVTDHLYSSIVDCVAAKGECNVVLPGGTTPARCLELLAKKPLPWKQINWYPGDERCYPIGHAERNDTMIMHKLFIDQDDADDSFHPIPAELGPVNGSSQYADQLDSVGNFDIVVLGMGEDGHTASLFPDDSVLHSVDNAVAVFHAPKPPDHRVSIGLKMLHDAAEKIIIATGAGKAEALRKIRAGAELPAALIEADTWFVDQDAMGDTAPQQA